MERIVLNGTPEKTGIQLLQKRLTRGSRVWSQAEQMWVILTAFVMFSDATAGESKTLTYGRLAKLMGYDSSLAGHTLGRPLELIGRLCLRSQLPPLNVVVVSKETGSPGAEVLLRPGSTVEKDQIAVAAEDWFSWRAPSANIFRTIWEQRNASLHVHTEED
jgi:hypothetical protein